MSSIRLFLSKIWYMNSAPITKPGYGTNERIAMKVIVLSNKIVKKKIDVEYALCLETHQTKDLVSLF